MKYMDRKLGRAMTEREVKLTAVVRYKKEDGLDCPFGTLTIGHIIEVTPVTSSSSAHPMLKGTTLGKSKMEL